MRTTVITYFSGLAAVALIAVAAVAFAPKVEAHPGHVEIYPGWNLIGLPGGETPEDVHAAHPCVTAIYRWDGPTQQFEAWFAGVPEWANSSWTIDPYEGHWVYCTP